MFYYQILPNKYTSFQFLTYSYPEEVLDGQLVEILIGTKKCLGIVLKSVNFSELSFDVKKIKQIQNILPFSFQKNNISFLYSFAYNTFNKPSEVLQMMLQSYLDFNKSDILELGKNFDKEKIQSQKDLLNKSLKLASDEKNEEKPKPINQKLEIICLLDIDILFRIIYLIRSDVYKRRQEMSQNLIKSTQTDNLTYLVIFPEHSSILSFIERWPGIINQIIEQEMIEQTKTSNLNIKLDTDLNLINLENLESNLELFAYSSKITAVNRKKFLKKMITNNLPSISIVVSTRSGIFIPFKNLTGVFVADESNNLHIQDQNNVYFDTRDAAFLISKYYLTSLYFISLVPSIRLHSFYSNEVLQNIMITNIEKKKSLPEVRYFERGLKEDNFDSILRYINQNIEQTHFETPIEEKEPEFDDENNQHLWL